MICLEDDLLTDRPEQRLEPPGSSGKGIAGDYSPRARKKKSRDGLGPSFRGNVPHLGY